MLNYNKATIVGRLIRDSETSLLEAESVLKFTIATNLIWTNKDGTLGEEVEFHNILVYGKRIDKFEKVLKKSTLVLVEGSIKTRRWTDVKGDKRQAKEIVADIIQYLK